MRGYLIYKSYADAKTGLCGYTERFAAMHSIIEATINGEFVGWMHVLNIKPRRTLRKFGKQQTTATVCNASQRACSSVMESLAQPVME